MKKILTLLFFFSTSLFSDQIIRLKMDMMILPGTENYLIEAFDSASEKDDIKLIIIELNTPGGILGTTQNIVKKILNSKIPVVVFVHPNVAMAASAGAFITMSAHIAAMNPTASIGAAHPVQSSGNNIEGDLGKKVENLTATFAQSIAESRNRNIQLAEEIVLKSISLTAKDALDKNIINFIADDYNSLLSQISNKEFTYKDSKIKFDDVTKTPIVDYSISIKHKFLNFISNPNISALLWMGATTGLTLELYSPGAIIPGLIGVICLILSLTTYQLIPINTAALILLIFGCFLFFLEFFITSGILAVAGIISIAISFLYFFDSNSLLGIGINYPVFYSILFFVFLCLLLIIRYIVKSVSSKSKSNKEELIGQDVEVLKIENNYFLVMINGEIWKAESEKDLKVGEKVEIKNIEGLKLII